MTGKRVRDKETQAIHQALLLLTHEVAAYRERLEDELALELSASQTYPHLVSALGRQIGQIRDLESKLDDEVLELVIGIANTSGFVSHARSREFF